MRTYKIVDATINHPKEGVIAKENIEYYVNGILESVELYSVKGEVLTIIQYGYVKA